MGRRKRRVGRSSRAAVRREVACEVRRKVAGQRLGGVVFRFHIVLVWRPQWKVGAETFRWEAMLVKVNGVGLIPCSRSNAVVVP